jgi:predicted Fe-Mo cluster-binding NifX family protein/ferredoxin
MKVAVTSTGPTLDDSVEARFGRCPYFLIVDTDSLHFEAVENPNLALGGGAGIQSAQMMAERGISHVLTGNCGPNAFRVFGQAGVEVIVGITGSVREAVERFRAGEFAAAGVPNVESHFGLGAGGQSSSALNIGVDPSVTRAPGIGMNRRGGMGGGRGMGRATGTGGRGGLGFGVGRHSARCGFMGFGAMYGVVDSFHTNQGLPRPADEPSDRSPRQGRQVGARAGALGGARKAAALVRPEKCAGCGICVDVCPVGAIRIERHAVVNPAPCTACAACVVECPNEAIIIVPQKV